MTRRFLLALLSTAFLLPTYGMGKRADKNQLTFHLEGSETDGPKMVFPLPMGNQKRFFMKSPLTFTKELVAYTPFVAKDGSAGATFAFTRSATTRIAAMTTTHHGKWLVAMLNGRPVDAVYIDNPVQDGRLVIWQGMKEPEIYAFDLVLPHIGEDRKNWQTRIQGYKKARKEAARQGKEKQEARNRRSR